MMPKNLLWTILEQPGLLFTAWSSTREKWETNIWAWASAFHPLIPRQLIRKGWKQCTEYTLYVGGDRRHGTERISIYDVVSLTWQGADVSGDCDTQRQLVQPGIFGRWNERAARDLSCTTLAAPPSCYLMLKAKCARGWGLCVDISVCLGVGSETVAHTWPQAKSDEGI